MDHPRITRLYGVGGEGKGIFQGRRADGLLIWWAMRIIAGRFRSRVLLCPRGMATRPTSDRLRETLFNVLAPRIEGAAFLDLYAGSGAAGLEALSRGAQAAVFVERAPAALKTLRANLDALGVERSLFQVHAAGVAAFLRSARAAGAQAARYDIVFLDPPYDAAAEYEATMARLGESGTDLLQAGAVVIAEHRRKEKLKERYGELARTRQLEQGDAALSFYAAAE